MSGWDGTVPGGDTLDAAALDEHGWRGSAAALPEHPADRHDYYAQGTFGGGQRGYRGTAPPAGGCHAPGTRGYRGVLSGAAEEESWILSLLGRFSGAMRDGGSGSAD